MTKVRTPATADWIPGPSALERRRAWRAGRRSGAPQLLTTTPRHRHPHRPSAARSIIQSAFLCLYSTRRSVVLGSRSVPRRVHGHCLRTVNPRPRTDIGLRTKTRTIPLHRIETALDYPRHTRRKTVLRRCEIAVEMLMSPPIRKPYAGVDSRQRDAGRNPDSWTAIANQDRRDGDVQPIEQLLRGTSKHTTAFDDTRLHRAARAGVAGDPSGRSSTPTWCAVNRAFFSPISDRA